MLYINNKTFKLLMTVNYVCKKSDNSKLSGSSAKKTMDAGLNLNEIINQLK